MDFAGTPLILLPAALQHDLPGELACRGEGVLPVANERGPPFGIRDGQTPEEDRISLRIDKFIALAEIRGNFLAFVR